MRTKHIARDDQHSMTEKATIYHNPRCSKSRAAVQLLQQHEIDVTTVEYMKTPINRDTLLNLLRQLDITPRQLLRTGESAYKALKLQSNDLSDDQLLDALLENPSLIERPIVSYKGRAAIGRPIDNIIELLEIP